MPNDQLTSVRQALAPTESNAPTSVGHTQAAADINALLNPVMQPAPVVQTPASASSPRPAPVVPRRDRAARQKIKNLRAVVDKKAAAADPWMGVLDQITWVPQGTFATPRPGEQIPVASFLTKAQYARLQELSREQGLNEVPFAISVGKLNAQQLALVMKLRAQREAEAAKRIEAEEKTKRASTIVLQHPGGK